MGCPQCYLFTINAGIKLARFVLEKSDISEEKHPNIFYASELTGISAGAALVYSIGSCVIQLVGGYSIIAGSASAGLIYNEYIKSNVMKSYGLGTSDNLRYIAPLVGGIITYEINKNCENNEDMFCTIYKSIPVQIAGSALTGISGYKGYIGLEEVLRMDGYIKTLSPIIFTTLMDVVNNQDYIQIIKDNICSFAIVNLIKIESEIFGHINAGVTIGVLSWAYMNYKENIFDGINQIQEVFDESFISIFGESSIINNDEC